jgi:hypothetical protein
LTIEIPTRTRWRRPGRGLIPTRPVGSRADPLRPLSLAQFSRGVKSFQTKENSPTAAAIGAEGCTGGGEATAMVVEGADLPSGFLISGSMPDAQDEDGLALHR